MVNPYEAPRAELGRLPFWKRFRRASRMAANEFRSGLAKEGLRLRDAFLTLAAWGLFLIVIGTWAAMILWYVIKTIW